MPRRASTKPTETPVKNSDGIFVWLLLTGVVATIIAITLAFLELDQFYLPK